MDKQKRKMQEIRQKEAELAFASPRRAAKLTSEIVRLKATVFD
jgi:hypothetical protein